MSSDSDSRVDILDLLINLLKEYEQKMDELTYRLETLLNEQSSQTKTKRNAPERFNGVVVLIDSWDEFKKQCTGALLVALTIDERIFSVTAKVRNILFSYEEKIPNLELYKKNGIADQKETSYVVTDPSLTLKSISGVLDCGLQLERRIIESSLREGGFVQRVIYYVDTKKTKLWLVDQLNIDESSIFYGRLYFREDKNE